MSTSVNAQEFRETLALWPSGVTVLTARDDEELLGMTISSFSSLSLEPPLILSCLDKKAKSHDGLIGARGFAVHVLARDQEDISRAFARPGPEKFDERRVGRGRVWRTAACRSASPGWSARTRPPSTAATTRSWSAAWSRSTRSDKRPLIYWDRAYRSAS